MRRFLRSGILCGALLAALVATSAVRAGQQNFKPAEAKGAAANPPASGTAPAANRSKRGVVALRFGSAKDLAAVLQKHFQGDAEIQAAPEPAGNSLLIAATPAAYAEVIETIKQLDRPSKKVIVDVLMFDEQTKSEAAAGKEAAESVIDERELTGPIDKVLARLESLSQQKKISNFGQMRIETQDNQAGQFQAGEEKPRVVGFTPNAATRVASPVLQSRQVGTIITVTPRVVEANKVLLELVFRNDRMDTPEDGTFLADGEHGPLIASEAVTANLQSGLALTPGQAALAGRIQTETKSKRTRTRIVVAARITEDPPTVEKQ